MKKPIITLYVATQKVLGSDYPKRHLFETIKDRNAFVRSTDYADIAGTVKLTPSQYEQWKTFGDWNRYEG